MPDAHEKPKPSSPPAQQQALEFVLGGPARYTRQDLVDDVGFDIDRAAALWQAMGFPQVDEGERAFTDGDRRALQVARELEDSGLIDERLMLVLARAMGQSISRLADAHVTAYVEHLEEQGADGTTDLSSAPLVDQIEWLLPRLDELVTSVWRRQLAGSLEQLLPHAADEQRPVSVGFTDLAGFTKLSRQLSRLELAQLTETFERTASATVADLGGRVVKTIGDEIMYIAFDTACAVEIGLALIDRLAEVDDLPAVHAGVATGPVLLRLGDVFGATVNIAARLTSIARADTLLVDKQTAEALDGADEYHVRPMRARRVSGYRHLQPFTVQRARSAR